MPEPAILLHCGDTPALRCRTVILVPAVALSESGHIQMFSTNTGPQTKHEFYALAQTALIRFQDEELTVVAVKNPMNLEGSGGKGNCDSGMAICRDLEGQLHVWAHPEISERKLLRTAHRFCARWIRLDI